MSYSASIACPECSGAGVYAKAAVLPEPPDVTCARCNGRGTVLDTVGQPRMRVSDPEDLAVIRSLSRTLAAVWVELTDEKSIPFGPGARAAIDKRLIDAVRTLKLEVELHRAAQAAIEDDARTTEGESLRETVTAPASVWHYEKPKHGGGPKTLLLTIGGIAIIGNWRGELGEAFVAWAALPKRDKAVERAVLAASKEKKA